MRDLDFQQRPRSLHHRMTRRAWYVVFGSPQVNLDEKCSAEDLALQMGSSYSDIEAYELESVLTNYLSERGHM